MCAVDLYSSGVRRGGVAPAGKVAVDETPHALEAACQVAGLVAVGLLVLSALMDLAFGTDFLSFLPHAVLAALVVAFVVGVWRAQKK